MKTKRCCGHKQQWQCANDYPDHMVPVENFSQERANKDGLQSMCKKCSGYTVSVVKHPVTRKLKRDWKKAYANKLGGKRGTPEWKSYLNKAEEQWKKEILKAEIEAITYDVIYNSDPPFNLTKTKRKLPKVDRPKSIRVTTKKVIDPRGYVYIFKDHMKYNGYGLYKIGASHNPQERLNQANTWGDFESVWESEMVYDCASLEKEVHQALSRHRVKGEWFQVDKTFIINKILELIDAGKEQEMGEQKVS